MLPKVAREGRPSLVAVGSRDLARVVRARLSGISTKDVPASHRHVLVRRYAE